MVLASSVSTGQQGPGPVPGPHQENSGQQAYTEICQSAMPGPQDPPAAAEWWAVAGDHC